MPAQGRHAYPSRNTRSGRTAKRSMSFSTWIRRSGAKAKSPDRPSFAEPDHERLADALHWVADPFLLSYDAAPEIANLYRGHRAATTAEIELLYTGSARSAGRELVISNLETLPAENTLVAPERRVVGRAEGGTQPGAAPARATGIRRNYSWRPSVRRLGEHKRPRCRTRGGCSAR